jgi:hypothetical protein
MIDEVAVNFPTLEFETVEFDFESAMQNTALPYTTALGSVYALPQRSDYLSRWLTDVSYNRTTVLVRNVSLASPWQVGFNSWVHILSSDYPTMEQDARRLLPTGFAWTFMNNTSFFNTVMYRRLDGSMSMRHNVSDMNSVFRDLLPPIVPYTMAESSAGRALLRYFSTVVYLISPDIPKDLPTNVAWIQLTGTERHVQLHNMSVPSAWYWKRNVEYMLPTVERGALLTWIGGILDGTVEATYRPSLVKEGDLSGDELWSWVRARKDALVFQYNSDEKLVNCRAALVGTPHDVSQLDDRTNDHESFPEWSRSGMVHYYHNGAHVRTLKCQDMVHSMDKVEL